MPDDRSPVVYVDVEVLEEFVAASAEFRQARFEAAEKLRQERLHDARELHREREADRRDRAAILRELRRLEGGEERLCACGCGRVFVPTAGPGRPQRFATTTCRWRAWWRERKEANGPRIDSDRRGG